MAAILLSSVPFWLSYQNFWVAMSEGLTAGHAFSPRQRLLIATAYAIAVLLTLLISIPFLAVFGRKIIL